MPNYLIFVSEILPLKSFNKSSLVWFEGIICSELTEKRGETMIKNNVSNYVVIFDKGKTGDFTVLNPKPTIFSLTGTEEKLSWLAKI